MLGEKGCYTKPVLYRRIQRGTTGWQMASRGRAQSYDKL